MPARLIDRERFFRSINYTPHRGQMLVHASPAARRVLACGVRWGKTKCAAMECVAASMEPAENAVGWVVAPSYELSNKVFREVARTFHEFLPHRIISSRTRDLELRVINVAGGSCEIRGKTAKDPTNLLGEGLDWLVVDEAARVPTVVWESYLTQRLVDKQGWAMLISTPKGKGWLYDLWRRGQAGPRKMDDYESWNSPSWDNPRLNRALIERERERLPEVVFRQEYGAEFIEGSGSVFHGVRNVAVLDSWSPPGQTLTPDRGLVETPERTYVAGLDLARVEDYTVLTVMDDLGSVVAHDRFTRLDWSLQVRRLLGTLAKYGNPPTLVDSTGMGEPVYEQLLAAGFNAVPYQFTNASKAALVNNLALLVERRMIRIPTPRLCPAIVDEMESFVYSITDAGNVRSGAPVGYHDDCVISLALACWILSNRPHESYGDLALWDGGGHDELFSG